MMDAPDGDLRIGHAERDAAVEQLREAAAEGRLTLDELDARIETALQSRTRAELRALLADLLPGQQLEAAINPTALTAQHAEPGWSWQDPLVLTAKWDDVFRGGPWQVPPFLELNPVAGSVKLDFSDARLSTRVIDVSVVGAPATRSSSCRAAGAWRCPASRRAWGRSSRPSTRARPGRCPSSWCGDAPRWAASAPGTPTGGTPSGGSAGWPEAAGSSPRTEGRLG
ncbi:DUF1707 domain-containing protein [Propioniciclava coleopterorum]|uniref:DUF1707 domain-containing protein n=1 Tax=Propioniciclava coleopterorum TaxID=2714937 RepID=A0A6G7Y9A6_9ACTN|nr:DUF1707 domain-containing protein [Propioniciclava coleopterorum]QIK73360.1 DUF1707 domain-containing protein [Propioniciclava coleopterorum]